MRHIVLAALLLLQSQTGTVPATGASLFPGFHPKSAGPFSFEINQPSREAFEAIAGQAGLNIVFLRGYQSQTAQLKLGNVSVYEALDALSKGSNSFWQPYDNKTIIVANDSAANHNFELQRLRPFHLKNVATPQQFTDFLNGVIRPFGLKSFTGIASLNTLVVKDSPGRVALLERRFADMNNNGAGAAPAVSVQPGMAFETDAAFNVYVLEGNDAKNITPRLKRLQPTSTGPFAIGANESSRSAFESIASKAGLTVVFDRDYPAATPIAMKLNDVDVYAALDLVSLASGSFWQPFGLKTIFVTLDNTTKRRDYDSLTLEVVDLSVLKTAQEVNDVMNLLRQSLNISNMLVVPGTHSLIYKDTNANVALAEKLITELVRNTNVSSSPAAPFVPTLAIEFQGAGALSGAGALFSIEPGGVRRNISPVRSQLQPKTANRFSLRLTGDARRAFEILAETGGITVSFDTQFTPGPSTEYRFDNVDIFEALDILSMQTRTFWQVLDTGAILVAPDSPTKRRAIEPLIARTFRLKYATPEDAAMISLAVRQSLNILEVSVNAASNSIEVRTTLNNITLAEKLVGALDKPSAPR